MIYKIPKGTWVFPILHMATQQSVDQNRHTIPDEWYYEGVVETTRDWFVEAAKFSEYTAPMPSVLIKLQDDPIALGFLVDPIALIKIKKITF